MGPLREPGGREEGHQRPLAAVAGRPREVLEVQVDGVAATPIDAIACAKVHLAKAMRRPLFG